MCFSSLVADLASQYRETFGKLQGWSYKTKHRDNCERGQVFDTNVFLFIPFSYHLTTRRSVSTAAHSALKHVPRTTVQTPKNTSHERPYKPQLSTSASSNSAHYVTFRETGWTFFEMLHEYPLCKLVRLEIFQQVLVSSSCSTMCFAITILLHAGARATPKWAYD